MSSFFAEKGTPRVDAETCDGCGRCVGVCPEQVFTMRDGLPQVGPGVFIGCLACGHCMTICPTGSVTVTGRDALVDDRIDMPPPENLANADQLESLLLARRSIRRFKKKEVDREAVDRILRMTSTAPMGIPPHQTNVIVFHGREKVQAFADDVAASFRKMAKRLSPVMLWLMRPMLGKEQYVMMREFVRPLLELVPAERDKGTDVLCYDAPLAMLFHYPPTADPADACIAATYATLAAESLGLGACMIGSSVALDYDKQFKRNYGIAKQNKLGLLLVIGHPAVKFHSAVRRRLGGVAFR